MSEKELCNKMVENYLNSVHFKSCKKVYKIRKKFVCLTLNFCKYALKLQNMLPEMLFNNSEIAETGIDSEILPLPSVFQL
jgi:hypothetical protein